MKQERENGDVQDVSGERDRYLAGEWTTKDFINHWTQANAELGATPIVLQGGYTLANCTAADRYINTTVKVARAERP